MNISKLLFKIASKLRNWKNHNTICCVLGQNSVVLKGCSIDAGSVIGKECFINTNTIVTKAEIGAYCSIGSNVVIGPGEHDLNKISTSGRFYDNAYSELTEKPCKIGRDVWIGTYAIIMRGVTVGDGAVIGANSVVTKNVPDFAVVAGVPAKILKYRFDEKTQNIIKDSNWWDLNLKDAKQLIRKLESQCKKN
ncbi:Streptogramin A acetyltransferase [Shewanella putrefaciens]|uniref:xenobiotic acyltransferase family protein n=1 Tax=Shewanella putrefaciens TaxID=24 RepID=UPI000DFE6F8E|nr:Streptogramin A acetyltransferase [Shewanella putrefaciens]